MKSPLLTQITLSIQANHSRKYDTLDKLSVFILRSAICTNRYDYCSMQYRYYTDIKEKTK